MRELARGRVGVVAKELGVTLDASNLVSVTDVVLDSFPVALAYAIGLERRVLVDGYNLTIGSNASALWDYERLPS